MTPTPPFEIFLTAPPGLEQTVLAEAAEAGFQDSRQHPGGVTVTGGWPEVWRANLSLRCPNRVLVRIASFRALHLAQLDKRARRIAWTELLHPGTPVKVDATTHASRIYHAGAATQRVERAIADQIGAPTGGTNPIGIKVRINDDLCTISIDTSGAPLHRRGHKQAVGKAPMRETLAAAFLRECGYSGDETLVDPMCGSGTFVLEAAGWSAGLPPGRSRHFAFEDLVSFDPNAWAAMRDHGGFVSSHVHCFGYDRDAGAIRSSRENAERAGVDGMVAFHHQSISDLIPPDAPPGLVMVNPPYGGRIGNTRLLHALHGRFGEVMRTRFGGWRVGLVTSQTELARATGLPFAPPGPPVPHGGLKIRLFRTGPLKIT